MRHSFKSGDAQQMERLAATPSNWRILNLNKALKNLRQVYGVAPPGFFTNKRLAGSIIIKHTLRDHERIMFENAPIVATKILVPLDENALAAGAISFFVGERAYPAIMRQSFGINVTSVGGSRDRDGLVLTKLNESPSLDIFLLRELLGGEEYGIAKDYFQISLLDDAAIKSFIIRELAPLIRIAIKDPTLAKISKFVESIFGAEIGGQAADFFQSLGLSPLVWGNVVFAWKAALFYETQFVAMQKRFDRMLADLGELKTYGHNDLYPRSFVENHLENLRGFADRAYQQSVESAQMFNSARRSAIIQRGQVQELKGYLETLPENVQGFGAFSAMIDHILSYWTYRTRGLDHRRMPAEIFCTVAADICAMENQFRISSEDTPYELLA